MKIKWCPFISKLLLFTCVQCDYRIYMWLLYVGLIWFLTYIQCLSFFEVVYFCYSSSFCFFIDDILSYFLICFSMYKVLSLCLFPLFCPFTAWFWFCSTKESGYKCKRVKVYSSKFHQKILQTDLRIKEVGVKFNSTNW